jgi:predicted ester cyclase
MMNQYSRTPEEKEALMAKYQRILGPECCHWDLSKDPKLEANKRLVRRLFLEIINKKAYEVADEILAPDFYWPQFNLHGPDGVRAWMRQFHTAFPDMVDIVEMQVAEGDLVVTLLSCCGTHDGMWLGMPPTGNYVIFPAVGIDRIRDGKIIERSATSNTVEFMRQAGINQLPDVPNDASRFAGNEGHGGGK